MDVILCERKLYCKKEKKKTIFFKTEYYKVHVKREEMLYKGYIHTTVLTRDM